MSNTNVVHASFGGAALTKEQRLKQIKLSHEASDEQAIATGQLIKSFKTDYPGSWLADVERHCGIGRARAYDYLAFAKGTKTPAEHKEKQRVANHKFQDSRKPSISNGQDDEDDGSEDPETIWSRGLLARAEIAEGDAAYEDWKNHKVTAQHVRAARKAAAAWSKLADSM